MKNLSLDIKDEARRLGFSYCGFAKAEFLEQEAPRLESWLANIYHGKMFYMQNNFDMRLDPRLLLDSAKTVIIALFNYFPDSAPIKESSNTIFEENKPLFSKFAQGKDYHEVLKKKLKDLILFIEKNTGEINARAFVDSAPILERAWAVRAGLGWIGKNCNLIIPKAGSFYFISEIVIDIELDYDSPLKKEYCGTCNKCIEACPTGALLSPQLLDSRKCIAYLTIESKDHIPSEYMDAVGNHVVGCDICQDVCPYNKFSKPTAEPDFRAFPEIKNFSFTDWKKTDKVMYKNIFMHSAVNRVSYLKFMDMIKK